MISSMQDSRRNSKALKCCSKRMNETKKLWQKSGIGKIDVPNRIGESTNCVGYILLGKPTEARYPASKLYMTSPAKRSLCACMLLNPPPRGSDNCTFSVTLRREPSMEAIKRGRKSFCVVQEQEW